MMKGEQALFRQAVSGRGWQLAGRPLQFFGWQRGLRFTPGGLGVPPRPLLDGDAERGRELLHGKFIFAGASLSTAPGQVFTLRPASPEWRTTLVTLGWMRDLAATGQELARLTARGMVLGWQQHAMPMLSTVEAARALITLSEHAAFLSTPDLPKFSERLAGIVSRLARRMASRWPADAEARLLKAMALVYAAVAFRFAPSAREAATARLAAALDDVILSDGGHVSRKPAQLVALALEIIPLREAMRLSHTAVPAALNAAIERMLPMVRLLCHGDGGVTGLQGGASLHAEAVSAILGADSSCGRPLSLAPHAGFGRLAYRQAVLIMDTGHGGPCHSPLAFEFSDGPQRIIVSCGRPQSAGRTWLSALSCSAAHSTWHMDEGLAQLRPKITAETISSPQGGLLRTCHTAAPKRDGARHERSLFLAATGQDLRGEDHVSLDGKPRGECLLRFHLHPAVTVEQAPHPNCVALTLPGDVRWSFSQAGGHMTIEDSLYFDGSTSPRPTRQIVVRSTQQGGLDVNWSLRRASSTGKSSMASTPAS